MQFTSASVEEQYAKDEKLKKEDIKSIQEWLERQPHLPEISELELILFLHSCYYSVQQAKTTIDNFYTVRTRCSELFTNINPRTMSPDHIDVGVFSVLPQLTPENYRVIYTKIVDDNLSKYSFCEQLKGFDMNMMLNLTQKGTAEGIIILIDMNLTTIAHMAKFNILAMKRFLFYLQEAMPVRLKGMHFINVASFINKILAMMKPFMKPSLTEVLHLHYTPNDTLEKFVPKECLPKQLGGKADTIEVLHVDMKKNLFENFEYFVMMEQKKVDETKRQNKAKHIEDVFGAEGSFKKLVID